MKILLSYTSHPASTAAFMETALRRRHDVITYGPCVDDPTFETDVIKAWHLESIRHRIKRHDIPLFTPDLNAIFKKLPGGWLPDLFLWIETGLNYPMEGIEDLPCLSACYFIDTNFHFKAHAEIAKRFNLVFTAMKPFVPRFYQKGSKNVFWIPVACDPVIHGKKRNQKLYDIGFVGTLSNSRKRRNLIKKLKGRFQFYYERCFLERMSEVFSQSKIVFNVQPTLGFNMRVFEAMASGSMLLTDETDGSGLSELFEDGRHLILYRNEADILNLADYYLNHDEERERIAQEGMEEVLARHTYDHRVQEITDTAASFLHGRKASPHFVRSSMPASPSQSPPETYRLNQLEWVLKFIPPEADRILDVGCREGIFRKKLKQRGSKEVVGIEPYTLASGTDKADPPDFHGHIEQMNLPYKAAYFDCIVFQDTLEHLEDPLAVINKMKRYLAQDGTIVACIPNIRYWAVINMLVEGHWTYQDYGILDRGHLKFFTKSEIMALFEKAGFRISAMKEDVDGRCDAFYEPATGKLSFGRVVIRQLPPEQAREFFVTRYLAIAQKISCYP